MTSCSEAVTASPTSSPQSTTSTTALLTSTSPPLSSQTDSVVLSADAQSNEVLCNVTKKQSVIHEVLTFASSVGRLFGGGGVKEKEKRIIEEHTLGDTDESKAKMEEELGNNSDNIKEGVRIEAGESTNNNLNVECHNLNQQKSAAVCNTNNVGKNKSAPHLLEPPLLNLANTPVVTTFPATPRSISAPSVSVMDFAMSSTPLPPPLPPGIPITTVKVNEERPTRSQPGNATSPLTPEVTFEKDHSHNTSSFPPSKSSDILDSSLMRKGSMMDQNHQTKSPNRRQNARRYHQKFSAPILFKSPRAVLHSLVPSDASQSRRMDLLLLHESPRRYDLTRAAWNGCSHTNRAHIWRLLVRYEPLSLQLREATLRDKRLQYRHDVRALYAPMGRVRFDCSSPTCTAEVENLEVYNVSKEGNLANDLDIVASVSNDDYDDESDENNNDSANDEVLSNRKDTETEDSQTTHLIKNNGPSISNDEENEESTNDETEKMSNKTSNSALDTEIKTENVAQEGASLKCKVIEYSSFSAKTLRQIEMDLPRTHPHFPIFHINEVRNPMRRILYIFGMLNPNNNYVQGMNEILSAVIVVSLIERVINKERRQAPQPSGSRQFRENPTPCVQEKINKEEKIIRENSKSPLVPLLSPQPRIQVTSIAPSTTSASSSSTNSPRSPQSPTCVSLDSFLHRTDLRGILTEQELVDAEADAYWTFAAIISLIGDNFIADQPGIIRRVAKLEEIVTKVDPQLSCHLARNGNDFLQFAFRWMNCLLMRELPFQLVIKLWDALLAHPNGIADFHIYFCAALLTRFSEELLLSDFEQCMLFLQHLPTCRWTGDDIDELLSQAFIWEQSLEVKSTTV